MNRCWKITQALSTCIAAFGCGAVLAQNTNIAHDNGVPSASAPSAVNGTQPNNEQGTAPPTTANNPQALAPGAAPEGGAGAHVSHEATQGFIDQAAYANQAEIAAGRYAIAHTRSNMVKAFAHHMIVDHSQADDMLKQLAEQHGYVVPEGVSAKDRTAMMRLERDHGGRFNAAYSLNQENDHRQVIAIFEQAERNPRIAPAVRRWAHMTLPVLMQHLHMANQLVASEAKGNRAAG